jgi:hypothetical protein
VKDLIFFMGLMITVPVGTVAASVSPRIRELFFFTLVAGTSVMHKLDINFLSREMYRGSTRGIEFSFLDFISLILLFSCLISPPPEKKRFGWPASLGFLLAYIAYCGISVLISEPKIFPIFEFTKILRGLLMFIAVAFYVSKPRDLVVLLLGLCAATAYVGCLSLIERYVWGMNRIPGPFEHYNEFSQYCCIMVPLLIAGAFSDEHIFLRTLFIGAAAGLGICEILTICRTGVMTFGLVSVCTMLVCSGLTITPKKILVAILIAIAAGGVLYKGWDSLMSRYSGTSLQNEYLDEDAEGRGLYLRIAARVVSENFFGVGLNNWSYVINEEYYPKMGLPSVSYGGTDMDIQNYPSKDYLHKIAPPAHNLGALTIGELGVPGFIIFYLLWGRWFHMGLHFFRKRTSSIVSRFGIGAFFSITASFLHCLTEYGFRHPHIFFLMHIIVATLAAATVMKSSSPDLEVFLRARLQQLKMLKSQEAAR